VPLRPSGEDLGVSVAFLLYDQRVPAGIAGSTITLVSCKSGHHMSGESDSLSDAEMLRRAEFHLIADVSSLCG